MSIDTNSANYLREQIAYLRDQQKEALKSERECRVMGFKTKSIPKKREYGQLEEYHKNTANELQKEIDELNNQLKNVKTMSAGN